VTGDAFAGHTITNQGTIQGTLYPKSHLQRVRRPHGQQQRQRRNAGQRDPTASATSPFSGGASIRVNGLVTIYVKGVIRPSGGAFSNTTKVPADLRILDSTAAPTA
jgi:hypothetical protein